MYYKTFYGSNWICNKLVLFLSVQIYPGLIFKEVIGRDKRTSLPRHEHYYDRKKLYRTGLWRVQICEKTILGLGTEL